MTTRISGTAASAGIANGPAFVITRPDIVIAHPEDPLGAFKGAAIDVKGDLLTLESRARKASREEAAAVLGAQALMAEDPMLAEAVAEALDGGAQLQGAVEGAAEQLAAMLAALEDEYLAARSADVLEVADRILRKLAGIDSSEIDDLSEASVIVAETLTAAETAQLDPGLVLGFATETGGPTGHVAVIARSLGIPAVVGASGVVAAAETGRRIVFDGETGEIVIDPDQEVLTDYESRAEQRVRLLDAAAKLRGSRIDFDGSPFYVAANVAGPDDVERAVEQAADGVGLYRTEFLFLDRATPPTEDEQYEIYAKAASAFSDTVVVRTFDIGGDKPAEYLDTPDEENPFLGVRGVRLYGRLGDLYRSQVRALLRAAAEGPIAIMIPMVATVADFLEAREVITTEKAKLESEGVPVGSPEVGVMIEVPAAALVADRLASHADFFSIGTNDLTQYTLAADRTSGDLAAYADAGHPAVLRLCHHTARAGVRAGIPTSVCGEAGSDATLAVLFAAMGITKLSVAPPAVNLVKSVIAGVDHAEAASALVEALDAEDAAEARAAVAAI